MTTSVKEGFWVFTGESYNLYSGEERLGPHWKIKIIIIVESQDMFVISKIWSKLSQMCHGVAKIWIKEIILLKRKKKKKPLDPSEMYSWVPGVHRPILRKICSYEISFTTGKYISIKNCYHKKTLLSLQLAKLLLRLPLRWKEGYIDSHTKHCFLSLHLHIPGRLNTWIWESLFSCVVVTHRVHSGRGFLGQCPWGMSSLHEGMRPGRLLSLDFQSIHLEDKPVDVASMKTHLTGVSI